MSSFLQIGRRLLPRDQVALVEPFDPEASPKLQTTREFRSRVIMINRDKVLTEQTPEAFAREHGFRRVGEEPFAINSAAVRFRVETFTPAEGFHPRKSYATRLLWRDADGNDQSKLLLTAPEMVLAAVMGHARVADQPTTDRKPVPARPPRKRDAAATAQP